jgi:hypothetical protein
MVIVLYVLSAVSGWFNFYAWLVIPPAIFIYRYFVTKSESSSNLLWLWREWPISDHAKHTGHGIESLIRAIFEIIGTNLLVFGAGFVLKLLSNA